MKDSISKIDFKKFEEGYVFDALFNPTKNDFTNKDILKLIGTRVKIHRNYFTRNNDFKGVPYYGQLQWYIYKNQKLGWFPDEDFKDVKITSLKVTSDDWQINYFTENEEKEYLSKLLK